MSRYNKFPEESAPPMELNQKDLPPTYNLAMYPNLPEVHTVEPIQPEQPTLPIQQQPAIMIQNHNVPVGNKACRITCPSCQNVVVTNIEFSSTTRTHLIALLLCLGGCCCCAPIPYCMDSCKAVSHNCPTCGAFIGTYKQ